MYQPADGWRGTLGTLDKCTNLEGGEVWHTDKSTYLEGEGEVNWALYKSVHSRSSSIIFRPSDA